MVSFSHALQRNSTWMPGNFTLKLQKTQNCLTCMLGYNVMQMRKVNCEKGYYNQKLYNALTRNLFYASS